MSPKPFGGPVENQPSFKGVQLNQNAQTTTTNTQTQTSSTQSNNPPAFTFPSLVAQQAAQPPPSSPQAGTSLFAQANPNFPQATPAASSLFGPSVQAQAPSQQSQQPQSQPQQFTSPQTNTTPSFGFGPASPAQQFPHQQTANAMSWGNPNPHANRVRFGGGFTNPSQTQAPATMSVPPVPGMYQTTPPNHGFLIPPRPMNVFGFPSQPPMQNTENIVSVQSTTSFEESRWGFASQHQFFTPAPIPFVVDMFKSGDFSDITLEFNQTQWKLHKCILASRSPFFKEKLNTDFANRFIIDLQTICSGLSTNTVLKALEFIYTIDTTPKPKTTEEAFEWIVCAQLFQLSEMISKVELAMTVFIETTTVFQLLKLAKEHKCKLLLGRCFSFISQHQLNEDTTVEIDSMDPTLLSEFVKHLLIKS